MAKQSPDMRRAGVAAQPVTKVAQLTIIAVVSAGALAIIAENVELSYLALTLAVLPVLVIVFGALLRASSQLRAACVMWGVLLFAEGAFARWGTVDEAQAGTFTAAAYGEGIIWVLIFIISLAVMFRSTLLPPLSSSSRWLLLFGILCAVSVAYAPSRLLTAAWTLKYFTALLILAIARGAIRNTDHLTALLKTSALGLVILTCSALVFNLAQPGPMLESGRFSHAVMVSERSGLLTLLLLGLYAVSRRTLYAFWAVVASAITTFGMGKAAIIATALSCALLFFLQKKTTSGVLVLLLLILVTATVATFTPVGDYLRSYDESEMGATLTGRTDLWSGAAGTIAEAPLLGHGYLASKFISLRLRLDWEAGHLHNAFLDVLYNLGLLGLILQLLMLCQSIRNNVRVLRRTTSAAIRNMAAVLLALVAYIVVTGMTEPSFGGVVSFSFLMFMMALVGSDVLDALARTEKRDRESLQKYQADIQQSRLSVS